MISFAMKSATRPAADSGPVPRRAGVDNVAMNRRDVSAPQLNQDLTPNPLYQMNMNQPTSTSHQQNRQRSQSIFT